MLREFEDRDLSGARPDNRPGFQEAVKLDPNNVRARLALGEVYLKSNAPAAAEKEAVEVLRRNPSNVRACVLYGESFLARKDW